MYHQPLITTDVILYVASDICSSLLAEGTALAEEVQSPDFLTDSG